MMSENGEPPEDTSHKFEPVDRQNTGPDVEIPDETVVTALESKCTFSTDIFHQVMHNLIKNPNITSSHLFRADIFYDSGAYTDLSFGSAREDLQKHLKPEYQPRNIDLPQWTLSRSIVRKLVPRNPQLDPPLLQTCHFYYREQDASEETLIVYIPHIVEAINMPFYHPTASKVLLLHTTTPTETKVSISYALYPNTPLTTKLTRTALRLLQTIHKHGQGVLSGYIKRVHHDTIIPQTRYQNTYTRLKTTYGRTLASQWIEVTDPGKHVFEDIAIAAFLIELWRDMYDPADHDAANPFPGFVDIGCGNGLLVYLLHQEGYDGWGFDARRRKTWATFPEAVQARLAVRLLVPGLLPARAPAAGWHGGRFRGADGAGEGPFVVSNHADELTLWTPLLAVWNRSSFLAIPCCSHDLSGARFRAPVATKAGRGPGSSGGGHHDGVPNGRGNGHDGPDTEDDVGRGSTQGGAGAKRTGAAETGSLLALRPKPPVSSGKERQNKSKLPSAYASLCAYLSAVTAEVGYKPETEVLRIPSTRNMSVIGRWSSQTLTEDEEARGRRVVALVERELGKGIDAVGKEWIARAEKLSLKPGSGH